MELDKAVIEKILRKRLEPLANFRLSDICFQEQLAFINDPSSWVTACCSRRAGKTEVCAIDLLNTAIKHSGVVCLYITITRTNAERIVWKKLCNLNDTYNLGGDINQSKLSITFKNGSVIYLSGCKDKTELDKFRGLALKLVYIDEVQSFRPFIRDLVDDAIGPALADYNGKLKLIGTPGPVQAGFFWESLCNSSYSHHKWTFFENPYIAKLSGKTHEEILDRELSRRGVTTENSSVRREWFGEWTTDLESLVFKYDRQKNNYNVMPDLTDYVLGVDLGFDDADAIAVIGWHKYFKKCYLVEELVVKQQGITELSDQIAKLIKKYDPLRVVMDTGGLGKKIAEELRKRSSLPIQSAEKSRKFEYIELLNDAMRTQSFFARASSKFATDSMLIEWDFDKTTPDKLVIKDEPHSDICDAVLYAYREALHWLSEKPQDSVNPRNKSEWIKHTQQLMDENLEKQIKQQELEENHMDMVAMMDMDMSDNPLRYYLNKRK